MNTELLEALEIDSNQDLKKICESLEEKQFEYLERLETVNDEERRSELNTVLGEIDKEILLLKDRIKTISNSIILYDYVPKKNSSKPIKEEKNDSSKEIAKKVEAFKAKEAEKKIKQTQLETEQIKKQISEPKNSNNVQGNVGQSNNIASNDNVKESSNGQNTNAEFTKGLLEYKKQNYSAAFSIFKNLAEQDNPQAQYMIANMYERGEACVKSHERAEFWMKKAADNGDTTSQMDYGLFLLSDTDGDEKRRKEGIIYLGMASEHGDKNAMLKYIDMAKKGVGDCKVLENAIKYCKKLMEISTDSYDAEGYKDLSEELKKIKKTKTKQENNVKRATRFSALGEILVILGFLYVFGGIHEEIWNSNVVLKIFPSVSQKLIIDFEWYWSKVRNIMNTDGMFGLELLVFGSMFAEAGNYDCRKKAVKTFEKISGYIQMAIVVLHFIALYQEGESLFKAIGWYIVVIVVSLVVGSCLGMILGDLTQAKQKKKK